METAQAQAPGLTVHDVLAAKVYLPEFIKACSARGVVPESQAEVEGLLNIAQNVRLMEIKQAEAGVLPQREPSMIEKAASASSAMLGGSGVRPDAYLQDPDVAAAFEAGGLPA